MTDPLDVLHGKAPAPPKLPFWASIGAAYGAWFTHIGLLLRIAGPWMAIILLPTAAIMWMEAPDQMAVMAALADKRPPVMEHPMAQATWSVVNQLLMLPALSSIAVAWHRRLLLDETPPPGLYLRLDNVVTGYGATAFIIGLMMYVPGWIVLSAQSVLGVTPLYAIVAFIAGMIGIVVMVIASRLSLALPARALTQPNATLGAAWRMTRGSTARLFFGYLFCLLPPGLLFYFIQRAVFSPDISRAAYAAFLTLSVVVWLFFGMLGIGFLSVSYRHFARTAAPAQI